MRQIATSSRALCHGKHLFTVITRNIAIINDVVIIRHIVFNCHSTFGLYLNYSNSSNKTNTFILSLFKNNVRILFFAMITQLQLNLVKFTEFDLAGTHLNLFSPNQHLFVQSQQWKHQNNVWNLFKVSNKNTRRTSMPAFWCLYC